jgi:hypothetical protein
MVVFVKLTISIALLLPPSGSTYSEINNSVIPLEVPAVVTAFTALLFVDLLLSIS